MSELVIRIPGEPFAQPRARAAVIAGRAVIYDPKKARNWKATAQAHMAAAWGGLAPLLDQPLAGPVAIRVLAVFTCPKSDHRKRDPLARRWHTKRPDADNVLKAVKDAAKGVLWLDDCQVCLETCIKEIGAQGEAPFVEIRIRALPSTPDVYAIAMAAATLGGMAPLPPAQPVLFEERT
jgi:Holliday junction resolvase RusA-like endonuclease